MHLFQIDVNKMSFSKQPGPNESIVFKHKDSGKFRLGSRFATPTFYFK